MPNFLGYTLLAMIAREASTGYDLAYRLKVMQSTSHSQIYPILAKLEQKGYLAVHKQEQDGKPAKKIYTITADGLTELARWGQTSLKAPIMRDEFIIKLQLDWLNPNGTRKLLEERKDYLTKQLILTEDSMKHFEQLLGLNTAKCKRQNMPYQIYKRRRDLIIAEIDWCNDLLT